METYSALLQALNWADGNIRDLIKEADMRGWPSAGRTITLPGHIGEVYGCSFAIDSKVKQARIEIIRPDVINWEDVNHGS